MYYLLGKFWVWNHISVSQNYFFLKKQLPKIQSKMKYSDLTGYQASGIMTHGGIIPSHFKTMQLDCTCLERYTLRTEKTWKKIQKLLSLGICLVIILEMLFWNHYIYSRIRQMSNYVNTIRYWDFQKRYTYKIKVKSV